MDSLSSELLHSIFTQVPLDQCLECTLVCRRWYTIIGERSLLFDFETHSNRVFDILMTMIQCHPGRGSQVKNLSITLDLKEKLDCLQLRDMFPNLRVFKYKRPRLINNLMDEFPIRSNENNMLDIAGTDRSLSTLNSWSKLGQFELSAGFRRPRKTLFSFLRDMPSLKKLTLRETALLACRIVKQYIRAYQL